MATFFTDTGSIEIISTNTFTAQTSSFTVFTQSILEVRNGLVLTNTLAPSFRFGGFASIDSGSSPRTSGSILFDSVNNQFIYVHASSGGPTTSSLFLLGPETYNDLGNEKYILANTIVRSTGIEHLTSSNFYDYNTKASIGLNTEITGSLQVTSFISASAFSGSFSGSLTGNGSGLTGISATSAPGGNNKDIQFNDNGTVSGSANFEFDKATSTVLLTGSLNAGTGGITGSFRGDGSGITLNGYQLRSAIGSIMRATASLSQSFGALSASVGQYAGILTCSFDNLQAGDVVECDIYFSLTNIGAVQANYTFYSRLNTIELFTQTTPANLVANFPAHRGQQHLKSIYVIGNNTTSGVLRSKGFQGVPQNVQTASRADGILERVMWVTSSVITTGSNKTFNFFWQPTAVSQSLVVHNVTARVVPVITGSLYVTPSGPY